MGKKNVIHNTDQKQQLLLGIKKDEAEIKKFEKLLGIRKRKKKSQLEELLCDLDPVSDDENSVNEKEVAEKIDIDDVVEQIDTDEEDVEKIKTNKGGDFEEVMDISEEESESKTKANKISIVSKNEKLKIKRNILAHLNRLCESQMMKCLDGFENIWNEFPRGDVRDIFIKESINYMKLSCLELSAFVSCLHFRLIKQTNLIAFFMEQLVEKLTSFNSSCWKNESIYSTVLSGYKFIAFITRLEVIDTNLIIDLMLELIGNGFDLQRLKILSEITSIIGFFIRKHNLKRCEQFIDTFKESSKVHLTKLGYLNEIRSFYEAIIDKLTTSKAKNDIVFDSVVKYRKSMRTWCRKSLTNENLALRLMDFRGENRVRWWLVGSAVNPNVVHNKNAAVKETMDAAMDKSQLSAEELEWNQTAIELGFVTNGKQRLFRQLMRGKQQYTDSNGSPDSISDSLVEIHKLSNGNCQIVPTAEIVSLIVRCLALEQEFCQFYVDLLVALIESNRRCRQLTKCAIWDLLAQPTLVECVKINIGRALGQMIAGAGFPVNSLRKFNFLDVSSENVAYMIAVISEIVEESWVDVCQLLAEMSSSISEKFINNLRIFLKKNFKDHQNQKFSKSTVIKIGKCIDYLSELRKSTH